MTALHLAALAGHEDAVVLLLAKGADIMARDERGWTALHWAVYGGMEDVIKLLLEKGADLEAEDNLLTARSMWRHFAGRSPTRAAHISQQRSAIQLRPSIQAQL